jgi:hypothetical protein
LRKNWVMLLFTAIKNKFNIPKYKAASKGQPFLLCAVHTHYLEGVSPLWRSVVTNH